MGEGFGQTAYALTVKRFSQFDVCNRALLDGKVFATVRRPIGLGDTGRQRRLWLHWPRMRRALVWIVVSLVGIWFACNFAFDVPIRTALFVNRGLVVIAYVSSLCFMLYPADSRMVALSRERTLAAKRGDGPVVRSRQQAWVAMLRRDVDSARNERWRQHPQLRALFMGTFATIFALAMLGDLLPGAANVIPFSSGLQRMSFIIALVTGFSLMGWHGKRLRGRLADRLEAGQCCDCGYQLERGLEGIGPKRCVECGCPWPLVPPELPIPTRVENFAWLPAWMRVRLWK